MTLASNVSDIDIIINWKAFIAFFNALCILGILTDVFITYLICKQKKLTDDAFFFNWCILDMIKLTAFVTFNCIAMAEPAVDPSNHAKFLVGHMFKADIQTVFVTAQTIMLLCMAIEWRKKHKKEKMNNNYKLGIILIIDLLALIAEVVYFLLSYYYGEPDIFAATVLLSVPNAIFAVSCLFIHFCCKKNTDLVKSNSYLIVLPVITSVLCLINHFSFLAASFSVNLSLSSLYGLATTMVAPVACSTMHIFLNIKTEKFTIEFQFNKPGKNDHTYNDDAVDKSEKAESNGLEMEPLQKITT